MKNLFKDMIGFFKDSSIVVKNHKNGYILAMVLSTILSFGTTFTPYIVEKVKDRRDSRKMIEDNSED